MKHFYIDEYSNINSLIHQVDPRNKIITFTIFVFFIVLTRPDAFITFVLYSIVELILILLSRIPLKYIFKKSLMVIPFVLIIGIFIPFLKNGRIVGIYSLGTLNLTITYEGLIILWNCFIKAYLSALCMLILMASTKFTDFLKALEKLKFPKLFTMIFSFMYRYFFVLQDELLNMKQGKDARTVGGSKWFHTKILSNMLGLLFVRSYERAESVYLAMCSRGFDGKIKTIDNFKFKRIDYLFSLITVGILVCIRFFRLLTR